MAEEKKIDGNKIFANVVWAIFGIMSSVSLILYAYSNLIESDAVKLKKEDTAQMKIKQNIAEIEAKAKEPDIKNQLTTIVVPSPFPTDKRSD